MNGTMTATAAAPATMLWVAREMNTYTSRQRPAICASALRMVTKSEITRVFIGPLPSA